MTDLVTRPPVYRPTGHPVRSFVAALLALAVVLGVLRWSGLAAPLLSVEPDPSGTYDAAIGRARAHLDLRNRGPAPVEVRRVTLARGVTPVPGHPLTSVLVNDRDIATGGQRIAGGGAASIDIEFTCPPIVIPGLPPSLPLPPPPPGLGPLPGVSDVEVEVTVRTPIGLERTHVEKVRLSPACPSQR